MSTASGPGGRFRENLTEITALIVTGVWLALLLSPIGGSAWLVALLLGYLVVVPIVALLYGDELDRKEWWDDWVGDMLYWYDESDLETDADGDGDGSAHAGEGPSGTAADSSVTSTRDALETLRDRYAAGELTDEQFERKLDRLLETETVEDANRWRREVREAASASGDVPGRDPDLDTGRDTDPGRYDERERDLERERES